MADATTTPKYPDVHVQLSGEDGNAFFILARVRRALRDAGVDSFYINQFTEEAECGNYDQLLQTVMRWVATS